jgi:hypothetical protein
MQMVDQAMLIKSGIGKLLWLVALLGLLLLMTISALPSMAGWIGTLLLGTFFPIALYIYRPGASFLRLHETGLDIAVAGRRRTINWSDVAGFHIGKNGGDTQIGILYVADVALNDTPVFRAPDADVEWIRDIYAMPLDTLCNTLNQWALAKNSIHQQQFTCLKLGSGLPNGHF